MSISKAYDDWSKSYDTDKNLTRDLDEIITEKTLRDLRFNSIFEIGCGTGKNTELLSKISEKVHAVDFSQKMILKAKSKIYSRNVIFTVADITKKWPRNDQSIDLVICNLVLEHINNLEFVFSEVSRTLAERGKFFVSELHPFRQYLGKKANFIHDGETTKIESFVHNISDFLNAADENKFKLLEIKEWWHPKDQNKLPRLVSFMFEKIVI